MRGQRMREWPYFPDWLEIFGKDRATGEMAEEIPVAATVMREKYTQPSEYAAFGTETQFEYENFVNLDDDTAPRPEEPTQEGHGENSAALPNAVPPARTSASEKRKHKADSSEPTMDAMLGVFCKTTGERLDNIAKRIGFEHASRRQVYGLLQNMQGSSVGDKLDNRKSG